MNKSRLFLWTLAAALAIVLTLALMACGPTAQPDSPAQPVIAQANPEPNPEPTPEPTPTIDWHSTVEPHPDNPMLPLHDPMLTPKAPYTPEPTRVPQVQPRPPEPTWSPPPAHPDGLAGCKDHGLFEMYKTTSAETDYMKHCAEAAVQDVMDTCFHLDSPEAQHACGIKVTSEYRAYQIRLGPTQCRGIDKNRFDSQHHTNCLIQLWDDLEAAIADLHSGWAKVHEAGNADPTVQAGIEKLVSCLVEQGHKDAHKDHILFWQLFEHPDDYHARVDTMTKEEKDLKKRLVQPTRKCAEDQGFFQIQEQAWIAALKKLAQEDPGAMDTIIREGMLVHLEEPGPAVILTGVHSPTGPER